MAIKTFFHGYEVHTIVAPDQRTRASFIPKKGGWGCGLIMPFGAENRELLFLHEFFSEKEWRDLPGGWPFLFPVCARVSRNGEAGAYLYDGHIYTMPMHGFAWRMPWELTHSAEDRLTLRLTDNVNTRAIFPFQFVVELTYIVSNKKLQCHQRYQNLSSVPMPYYAGFHPYFLTPPVDNGKENVRLNYSPSRRFLYNKNFTEVIGEQSLFTLPSGIDNPELNEQLTWVGQNNTVSLSYPDGFELTMSVNSLKTPELFSYIQLYTMKEKPFFCVEPWMSFPNAMNTVKGVRWLQPGCEDEAVLELSLNAKMGN